MHCVKLGHLCKGKGPIIEPVKAPLSWPVREEIANVTLHSFGLFFSLIGVAVLMSLATLSGSLDRIVSSSIYGVSLLMVFTGSILFHTSLAMESRFIRAFEIVDHCAIFLLIAGSYTPFLLVLLKGWLGSTMLALVWGLAFAGILYKIFFANRSDLLSVLAYIAMGWMLLFIIKPLLALIGWGGIGLIGLGGLFYTVGAVFYLRDHTFRFAHAVWHIFVIAGSVCHYFAILLYVIRP